MSKVNQARYCALISNIACARFDVAANDLHKLGLLYLTVTFHQPINETPVYV